MANQHRQQEPRLLGEHRPEDLYLIGEIVNFRSHENKNLKGIVISITGWNGNNALFMVKHKTGGKTIKEQVSGRWIWTDNNTDEITKLIEN